MWKDLLVISINYDRNCYDIGYVYQLVVLLIIFLIVEWSLF